MMNKSKEKIRKSQLSKRLKVCIFLVTFEPKRHMLLKRILETQNVEVQVCCEPIKGRFSMVFANIKLFFRHFGLKYDVLLIPWWGMYTFPVANLICRKPIVYKASVSFYNSLINEVKLYKPGSLLARIYHFFEHHALKNSDKILTESDAQISYLSKEYNIPIEKFEISVPSADETMFKPITLKEQGDCFNVLFFGTFSLLHGTDTIIKAAKILSNNKDIIFNFCGNGFMKKSVEKFSKDNQLENVNFFGYVKNEVLLEKIKQSDIMLGIFGKSRIAEDSITNKVCQVLASQKAPSSTMVNLARAYAQLKTGKKNYPLKYIGIRAGEKIDEILVSQEEMRHVEERKDHFVIKREAEFDTASIKKPIKTNEYGSNTGKPLSVDELIQLMKKLKWVL